MSGVFCYSAIHGLGFFRLLYDIEVMSRKTIKHAFAMFYTLIKVLSELGFIRARASSYLYSKKQS